MAEAYDNNSPKPKKAGTDPRMADLQRRAQAMTNRKPVGPRQFFEEAWVELKKTTWPDRETLTKSTTVVLALVLAVAIWVGFVDFIFTRLGNVVFVK